MAFLEKLLTVPFGPIIELKKWYDEREKKKGVKEQLLNVIDSDIEVYSNACDKMLQLNDELISLIKEVDNIPSDIEINRFLKNNSKMVTNLGKIIQAFVNLARNCKLISLNPGFMRDLLAANTFLHDFVVQMALMVNDQNIAIMDERFYTFLKLNEKKFIDTDIAEDDVEDAVDEIKPYLLKFKNSIAPSISRRRIRKKTKYKIIKSYKSLKNKTKDLIIKQPTRNITNYLPKEFRPASLMMEEIAKSEER